MTAADFMVEFLISKGVTDMFGIPGGVILELMYAAEKRKEEISIHLNFHEQAAAFAACGYAQTEGSLGVAYATRGPGILNMVTAIADAYSESTPVLFITAHSSMCHKSELRFETDQELDIVSVVRDITKYAVCIDKMEDVVESMTKACFLALDGRKGPVLIDILSGLLSKELEAVNQSTQLTEVREIQKDKMEKAISVMNECIEQSRRPVFLIGDGVRQAGMVRMMKEIADKSGIPVLSGRCSQDIMADSDHYYGYIGSHGIRYANFILSKADLILSIGNRLAFPIASESFVPIFEKARLIRVDIDKAELSRAIPNSISYEFNIEDFLPCFLRNITAFRKKEWLFICDSLREELWEYDFNDAVIAIKNIINKANKTATLVCDVGNNEFWVSRAYIYEKSQLRNMYSKSFGTLGCGIGKAIGVYYRTKEPVILFVGDQGIQMNLQELQYISYHRLPIVIVILNNYSSGMIKSRQKQKYNEKYIHTTLDSGYSTPEFKNIAEGYNISYYCYEHSIMEEFIKDISKPVILEVKIDKDVDLEPYLLIGDSCQEMSPKLKEDFFDRLNIL